MKRILIFLMLLVSISLSAQDVAVKTNLLYDATTTINLGAEIISPKTKCNPFSKRFVQFSLLLAQNEM